MSKIQIFPFAPGIIWKLRVGKYVLPEISATNWKSVLNKNQVTIALPPEAGLLEVFYSFSFLEVLNQLEPQVKLYWSGPSLYHHLVQINGLSTPIAALSLEILKEYPTPIFLDRNQMVYFNCLNNYLEVYSYYGTKGYKDKRAAIQQIVEKTLIPWNSKYLPKLRNWPASDLSDRLKNRKIYPNSPYILLIPDITLLSKHKVRCLNWDSQAIKALAAMLSQIGILTFVITTRSNFFDNIAITLPFKIDYILQLLPQAQAILACEIDFLLLALGLSQTDIITIKQSQHFSLEKNRRFLGSSNLIYSYKKLDPLTAFYSIQKKWIQTRITK